ncbi:hypothetical protein ASPWEDRAFT_176197 [Aspergillus wentii DTO 134E9]|uniref:Uncharacterized protein n=1 Tax=Aspergillus wentii DTO 134E9 TaxID=1073089 RepID=A0A1L9R844_ASPWE|nr:uncharacterized protein ASPWEDRAFT_176197 [Aspergillus wentii DTO 134E9]KAI9924931.1 hypothetical protein MW887_006337 [Aspergillus wentii]OJJ31095.1 hypothetical protein ASPWEDRAFT_176197 [Aspergillus wentii DTO 134E9]
MSKPILSRRKPTTNESSILTNLPGITAKQTADVACLLSKAKIPHILWGSMAMRLMGVLNPTLELEFVIADKHLPQAHDALLAAGYLPCQDTTCIIHTQPRNHPTPNTHVHIPQKDPREIIGLYNKSEILWHLPKLDMTIPDSTDEDYMLASNTVRLPPALLPGGGKGPFPADLFPVKMLTPSHYVDCLIILACRDYGHCARLWWLVNLQQMVFYPEDLGLIDESEMRRRYLPFWRAFHGGMRPEVYGLLGGLQKCLREMGELPVCPYTKNGKRA